MKDGLQQRNADLSAFRAAENQAALGYLIAYEAQAPGDDAGAMTALAWNIRALNVIQHNTIPGSDVTALPAITLPRGVYDVWATAVGYQINRHVIRLYDVTNATELIHGVGVLAPAGTVLQIQATLDGRIHLAGDTALRLEHMCQTHTSNSDAGESMGDGGLGVGIEIYAILRLYKVG